MGLLTLLDSRTHRNDNIWKRVMRFIAYIRRAGASMSSGEIVSFTAYIDRAVSVTAYVDRGIAATVYIDRAVSKTAYIDQATAYEVEL